MKKFWKTINQKLIYESQNNLYIYENQIYRWLTLNSNMIQTLINKYQPHKPSLKYIKAITLGIKNVPKPSCLLGLGGGGLAHFIDHLNIKLTTVEISNEVINLASKYFMINKLKNLDIINQDANLFVSNHFMQYHHLIIDIYNSDNFPSSCMNYDFFENCRLMLNTNGMLAINIAGVNEYLKAAKLLKHIFNNKIISIPIKNTANFIIYAINNNSIEPLITLFQSSKDIKSLIWSTEFGYIASMRG
jgi:spermidine synthase